MLNFDKISIGCPWRRGEYCVALDNSTFIEKEKQRLDLIESGCTMSMISHSSTYTYCSPSSCAPYYWALNLAVNFSDKVSLEVLFQGKGGLK